MLSNWDYDFLIHNIAFVVFLLVLIFRSQIEAKEWDVEDERDDGFYFKINSYDQEFWKELKE